MSQVLRVAGEIAPLAVLAALAALVIWARFKRPGWRRPLGPLYREEPYETPGGQPGVVSESYQQYLEPGVPGGWGDETTGGAPPGGTPPS